MEGEGGELTRVSTRALLSKTTQKYLIGFQPLLQGHSTLFFFAFTMMHERECPRALLFRSKYKRPCDADQCYRDDARMLGKNGLREYELGYREAPYLDAKT